MPQDCNKAQLINHLAGVHGYRHYLELCSATTGGRYAEIDRSKLLTCRRLIYRCPEDFADGLPVDYRSGTLDIGECLNKIGEEGRSFDIVLVDSWHEYGPSWRDLCEAYRLIGVGGTLLVHDCLPPNAAIADPRPVAGEWCGVSYQAYIDFVTGRDDLAYYTVDTDYGCGVIRKLAEPSALASAPDAKAPLLKEWKDACDRGAAYAFFDAHRERLLNLVSVEAFFARERSALGSE